MSNEDNSQSAEETAADSATEAAAAPHTDADGATVGGAVAHLMGVSRPQDEYGPTSSDRDALSDDELLAMGVEPDAAPGGMLMGTFLGLVAGLLVVCVGVAAVFNVVVQHARAERGVVRDTAFTAAAENASTALQSYARVEQNYQVPVDVAMDVLVRHQATLLGRHPLGHRTPEELTTPPNAPPEPEIVPDLELIPDGSGLGAMPADGQLQLRPIEGTELRLAAPGQLQLQPATH
ncbi:MAG: hypothetical protein H6700_03380 [Myxococcales bacterium]|nr:hypothetical protein [Myxococcales bacterium]MCB9519338.1 hypothetical protein [Myxococcales bacterium]MCB9530782.1 hypothetical protein [Myxococcales bacterium]